MLKKTVAASLSAVLGALSPGFTAYAAAAQTASKGPAVSVNSGLAVGAVPTGLPALAPGLGISVQTGVGVPSVETSGAKVGQINGLAVEGVTVIKMERVALGVPTAETSGTRVGQINGLAVDGVSVTKRLGAAAAVTAVAAQESVAAIAAQGAQADLGAGFSASQQVFDNAAKTGADVSSVEGTEGRGGSSLSKAKGAAIALVATVAVPATALANDGSAASGDASALIPAVLIAGASLVVASVVGRTYGRVVDTLGNKPSEDEVAQYLFSQEILQLEENARRTFYGDRMAEPGVTEAMRREIRSRTEMEPSDAVAKAWGTVKDFNARYAAYNHPILAKIARAFNKGGSGGAKAAEDAKKKGGSGLGSSESADAAKVSQARAMSREAAEARHAALKRELRGIYWLQMAAGHRDVIIRDIELVGRATERIPGINAEMDAIEKAHPGVGAMSRGARLALAAGVLAATTAAIAFVSTGAAVAVAASGLILLAAAARASRTRASGPQGSPLDEMQLVAARLQAVEIDWDAKQSSAQGVVQDLKEEVSSLDAKVMEYDAKANEALVRGGDLGEEEAERAAWWKGVYASQRAASKAELAQAEAALAAIVEGRRAVIVEKVEGAKKEGGSGLGSSEDAGVPQEAAERYAAAKSEAAGIRSLLMAAGHRDMIGIDPYYLNGRSNRLVQLDAELRALEKEHPGLVKTMGFWAKLGITAGLYAAAVGAVALFSSGTAVVMAVPGLVILAIALNVRAFTSGSAADRKRIGEMAENLSKYK